MRSLNCEAHRLRFNGSWNSIYFPIWFLIPTKSICSRIGGTHYTHCSQIYTQIGDYFLLPLFFCFLCNFTEPISFMDTPTVQSARENAEAIISCKVKGDPEPSVSWYFNGQLLNGKLLFVSFVGILKYTRGWVVQNWIKLILTNTHTAHTHI